MDNLKEKAIKKAEELNYECYVVVSIGAGYVYMFHSNGAYDKLHEKTYGLLTCRSLKENLLNNDLFNRAESIKVCGSNDSWTYGKYI